MNGSTQSSFALLVFALLIFFFLAALAAAGPAAVPTDVSTLGEPVFNDGGFVPGTLPPTPNFALPVTPTPVPITADIIINADTVINGNTTLQSNPVPGQVVRHEVQRGEWLRGIAQRYGTTVEAILQLNPEITNPDLVQPGQVLLIPINGN
ncbi:MAG: LysM domain-containing protein [Caldilineaceae bacterium]